MADDKGRSGGGRRSGAKKEAGIELIFGNPPFSAISPDAIEATPPQRAEMAEAIGVVPGYDEFEIDIEKVMRVELPAHFASIESAPLTPENILLLPERAKGAYMLFLDGAAVYAGKTDTRHGFRDRLGRHHYTLQHRQRIDCARMSFKAVRIMVFSNFDAEAILIDELRRVSPGALPWNDTGFGSNDPGHNREYEEPGDFDRANPINIDMPLDPVPLNPGPMPVLQALIAMKDALPYTFRYETDPKPNGKTGHYKTGHVDQRRARPMRVPVGPLTLRRFLTEVLRVLPEGWRVTVFPGRVILYKEPTAYRYALESFTK